MKSPPPSRHWNIRLRVAIIHRAASSARRGLTFLSWNNALLACLSHLNSINRAALLPSFCPCPEVPERGVVPSPQHRGKAAGGSPRAGGEAGGCERGVGGR